MKYPWPIGRHWQCCVAPFTGAWIEIEDSSRDARELGKVAPFTGAWIEISGKAYTMDDLKGVAPFTGAWIEIITAVLNPELTFCRTLHGCVD